MRNTDLVLRRTAPVPAVGGAVSARVAKRDIVGVQIEVQAP